MTKVERFESLSSSSNSLLFTLAHFSALPILMKAWVLYGKEDLRLEDHPKPELKPGEVLIKTRRVGVCGSDVHYFMDGRVGSSIPKRPFVFGHEAAGEVAELGDGVEDLQVGMRVAIDPSQACGKCPFCRSGRYNLCRSMSFLGSAKFDPPTHGTNREYFAIPAANCFPMPDVLDDGQAAMLEPLSVATHGVMRAGNVAGKSVLVTGGGPIGQMAALVTRAFGADSVSVSDVADYPRRFAKEVGADFAIDPTNDRLREEVEEIVPSGFDIVLEASGAPAALRQALELVAYGGSIVQIGTLPSSFELPFNTIMEKELQMLGSFRFAHVFPLALKQMAAGRIDLKPMISQVFPFEQLPDALRAGHHKGNNMKIQVEF